jgi:hypothetical protein
VVMRLVTDGQVTDGSIIQCMYFACWIPKATNTHSQFMSHLLLFHSNISCTNAIRMLSVFLDAYGSFEKLSEYWLMCVFLCDVRRRLVRSLTH